MKKVLPLLLLFLSITAETQVKFKNFKTLDEVFKELKKSDKILFLHTLSDECFQCNQVALMALESKYLTDKYNDNFISLSISKGDKLYDEFSSEVKNFTYCPNIFINKNKIIVEKLDLTTSNPMTYIDAADRAINKNAISKDVEKSYANLLKNRNKENLRLYILNARKIDLFDCEAMDDLVERLSPEDKNDHDIIKFILEQGCNIYSKSYSFTSSLKNDLRNNIWYKIDDKQRTSINQRFRKNSFEMICENNDEQMLNRFTRITIYHYMEKPEGYKQADRYKVDFYKRTKNIDKFLTQQLSFVDTWLNYSIDSLNKLDVKEKEKMRVKSQPTGRVSFRPQSEYVATQLNNAAYQIYENTDKLSLLTIALEWSKKSIDILAKCNLVFRPENEAFYDTHAHLLHKLDRIDEAILWQQKAVNVNNSSGFKDPKYQKRFDAIKERKI